MLVWFAVSSAPSGAERTQAPDNTLYTARASSSTEGPFTGSGLRNTLAIEQHLGEGWSTNVLGLKLSPGRFVLRAKIVTPSPVAIARFNLCVLCGSSPRPLR